MKKFKDSIDSIEDIKGYPDMIRVWVNSTGWPIQKGDFDSFCSHMDDWYSVSYKSFSRSEYEDACIRFDIESIPDAAIGSGDGDFGMCHYHTDPENHKTCMRATLLQSRWNGMVVENPNIKNERKEADFIRIEALRIEALRATYPVDLDAWITAVGGLETIYNKCTATHVNNSVQLRDEGRHFEWLIGHTCMRLGFDASKSHPDYVPPTTPISDDGVDPLFPKWWGGWDVTDREHPINRIAALLSDRRIEPYLGKVTYYGYGEDCGDDVRRNFIDNFR